jgi:transposase InsO family protein
MSHSETNGPDRERWARLRFAVVGPLLAAPPEPGALQRELERLARQSWQHPVSGAAVQFAVSTIERWYYAAKNDRDPVAALRRQVRSDAGQQKSLSAAVREALHVQHRAHPSWTVQLHYDNLKARGTQEPALAPVPSYASVRRYMKTHALWRQLRLTTRSSAGAEAAAARRGAFEIRSYESEHVNGLWHADFHHASRPVLSRGGRWETPVLFGVLDDHSRLACHLQWYREETAETFVHGLCQALQKRALPRALMTDNGGPMTAEETRAGLHALGIVHETTLPYSPYQNAKQENFWASVEGRLMAMLEGCSELTLTLLNEATQAWAEQEYNRRRHSELGCAPLERYLGAQDVGRESPGSDALRRAFRAEVTRRQRRSDGTFSLEGARFEVPGRFRHLETLTVRYARWDLSAVELVDPRHGTTLGAVYPLDKSANADGKRRRLAPLPEAPSLATSQESQESQGMAPLLRALMAEYAATGLPPAYLPMHRDEDQDRKTEESRP